MSIVKFSKTISNIYRAYTTQGGKWYEKEKFRTEAKRGNSETTENKRKETGIPETPAKTETRSTELQIPDVQKEALMFIVHSFAILVLNTIIKMLKIYKESFTNQ